MTPNQRTTIHHESIDSTSTELKRLISRGAEAGTVVTATTQISGRGRRGRDWHSPKGTNLYISVAVSVGNPGSTDLNLLPLAAGVAAVDAMNSIFPVNLELKWPNDVLLDGRKTAGILCEVPDLKLRPLLAVVGLGVNIGEMEFPDELRKTATSLVQKENIPTKTRSSVAIADHFVANLELWMYRIRSGDGASLIDQWLKNAEPFGRRVRVDNIEGITKNLDEDGRLIILKDNGQLETVAGGIVESVLES